MNTGTIVGEKGIILRTINGGLNWSPQLSGTTNYLADVAFLDADIGTIVGAWGTILKTTDGGGVTFIENESNTTQPNSLLLSQNYPNPFNPSTIIIYQFPIIVFVTLKVYDILGREVATLVNEEKPAGSYEVQFDCEGIDKRNIFLPT